MFNKNSYTTQHDDTFWVFVLANGHGSYKVAKDSCLTEEEALKEMYLAFETHFNPPDAIPSLEAIGITQWSMN